MENQEKLMQFVTWLGENVPELKGKSPEQIVESVNKLSASEQGQQMLQGLIKEFESSMTDMFKKGGKLDYLICLKSGGNVKECGCGCKKIRKGEEGIDGIEESVTPTKYSRRDAIKAGRSMGFSRAQSVNAYNNALSGVMNQGFKGSEARQAARANMINAAGQYAGRQLAASQPAIPTPVFDDIVIEDEPIDIEPVTIDLGEDKGLNIKPMDTFYGSFNSAFGAARRSGLKEFNWNGKRYNTKLATKPVTPTTTEPGWKQAVATKDNANQQAIDAAYDSAKNAKTGFGKTFKTIGAGLLQSTLDSPTMGLQMGGVVGQELLPVNPEQYPHASKKDAIEAANQLGLQGAAARRAYGDSKKFMRKQGLRGNNMRQAARYNLIDMAYPRAGMTEQESMENLLNNFVTKISYN